MRTHFDDLAGQRLTFREVVVGPTEAVMQGPHGTPFRGGPRWPDFQQQVLARHCRGVTPTPVDQEPTGVQEPLRVLPSGVWCGPIFNHYGHQIADFGMRIAHSAAFSDGRPLLFSLGRAALEDPDAHVPGFFWQILDRLGVPRSRVTFVLRPVLVRDLIVFPQAERHHGAGPSEAHLDFMDATYPSNGAVQDIDAVYVSRSRSIKGGIAGERYLDEALRTAGVTVIWPELLPLARQIDIYRRARTIIFAEGSAIHTLQLLGRVNSRVVIVCRRSGKRIAEPSLTPRARSVDYVDGVKTLICGLKPSGFREKPRGVTILDSDFVFERISEILSKSVSLFDRKGYEIQQSEDLRTWMSMMAERINRHPDEDAIVARLLERAGVAL